jgi:tRNA pseudouridine55 synthase
MLRMNGALFIDKPPGLTSHDVVARVRHILHERRVGHTGTLDPFATGLLLVLVGRATRLAQFLSGLDKEYEGVIRLGYATDTGDATGRRIEPASKGSGPWTKDEIEAAMTRLRGEIDQIPPMYSAKKQDGRKLYELARAGQEVVRAPVRIGIQRFEPILRDELLQANEDGTYDLKVRVACTAGTYIRVLAEDFGRLLGVGAHLVELRRTRVGDFLLAQADTLATLQAAVADEAIGEVMHLPDEVLARFPFFDLNTDEVRKVVNGLGIKISESVWTDGERVRMREPSGSLIAVGVFNAANEMLRPSVVIA